MKISDKFLDVLLCFSKTKQNTHTALFCCQVRNFAKRKRALFFSAGFRFDKVVSEFICTQLYRKIDCSSVAKVKRVWFAGFSWVFFLAPIKGFSFTGSSVSAVGAKFVANPQIATVYKKLTRKGGRCCGSRLYRVGKNNCCGLMMKTVWCRKKKHLLSDECGVKQGNK